MIESPTLLDVAAYIHAIRRADAHGYGKYSGSHGKFTTDLYVVATGYPKFSVLDMLAWADDGKLEECFTTERAKFDGVVQPVALYGEDLDNLAANLTDAFRDYLAILS
jgi:hypothetical protein